VLLVPKNHNIACNIRCTRHLIRLHYPLHYKGRVNATINYSYSADDLVCYSRVEGLS